MYNEKTKNIYQLPFDESLNLKPKPAPKHHDSMRNALDFSMPEGTPIYAALEGTVVEIKEDSKTGGSDESFRPHANLIRIKHDNEEYSEYVHLRYKSIKVKLNQHVKKGELIGYSGNTGFTGYPHLHFGVYCFNKEKKARYLIIEFKIRNKVTIFDAPIRV